MNLVSYLIDFHPSSTLYNKEPFKSNDYEYLKEESGSC
jgi:hypothetical protein